MTRCVAQQRTCVIFLGGVQFSALRTFSVEASALSALSLLVVIANVAARDLANAPTPLAVSSWKRKEAMDANQFAVPSVHHCAKSRTHLFQHQFVSSSGKAAFHD